MIAKKNYYYIPADKIGFVLSCLEASYIFSNENLKEGDKVFPISDGFIGDDGKYYHQYFNFDSILSDFPDEPHVIINLKHSDYKPYEVRTDKGYGPIESYYKVMNIVKLNRGK